MNKYLFTLLLALHTFFVSSLNAQLFDGLETVLTAQEDTQNLLQGYTSPLAKSFIYGLNTGWAHTAKTHKQLGFDLTIGAGLSTAPDSDLTFIPQNLNYVDSDNLILPTVLSNSNAVPIDITIPANGDLGELRAVIDFPGGVGGILPVNGVPVPTIQASVGVILNTDIIVRYVPETNIEGAAVSLSGFGFKHDLTQYLGPIDNLPVHLSFLAAQTTLSSKYNIESSTLSQNAAADMRYVDFNLKARTIQLLGSIDFPFISVFGAVGISRGTADLGMKGVYNLTYNQKVGDFQIPINTSITDPLNLNYDANSTLTTIGARLNLAFLKIYAQYSLQEYKTLSAGVSLGLR